MAITTELPHSRSRTVRADALSPMQRLDALVNWERSSRHGMVVDLAPISDLLLRLNNPQDHFRSVHVTGTKGKGSVCSLVDAGLRNAGLRVGRYASPHLESTNERICIDGAPVSDEALDVALLPALNARDAAVAAGSAGAHASWFDVMTVAAFVAFERAKVDWAVVEVGIGGLRDSTNVISAEIAVITNIGLEHTDVLGSTVEAIAAEKAGIVKVGMSLITPVAPESREGRVIYEKARQCGAAVNQVDVPGEATITALNLATARAVLDELGSLGFRGRRHGPLLDASHLTDEVASGAAVPGRLERFEFQRTAIALDGAHVDFALTAVVQELRQVPRYREPPIVLLALGQDKDAEAFLKAMRHIAARVVCTNLSDGRPAWPADRLLAIATSIGLPAETAISPEQGLERCLELAAGTWVLVTGSLYLVGSLRQTIVRQSK